MTTIIITEYYGRNGKYWTFNIKGNGDLVAEVDRINNGYKVYSCEFPFKTEVTTRSRKESAFTEAKQQVMRSVSGCIEFKNNVVRWHEK